MRPTRRRDFAELPPALVAEVQRRLSAVLGFEERGGGFSDGVLGVAVYRRRLELGLSQSELAERAGMTQPQVSRLEGGAHMPTIPLTVRLAAALEIDVVVHGDVSASVEFRPHAAA
ncbi:helix-turn-helix domain-containing protein [Nonomuraea helvata]|uniref:Helix-turn-helix domain-containing protein n=1 Tax=Nonomuraea helvata TaxID=37484 RepID=A0ABV5SBE9_9ACTN